jgi:hypothetical protein
MCTSTTETKRNKITPNSEATKEEIEGKSQLLINRKMIKNETSGKQSENS